MESFIYDFQPLLFCLLIIHNMVTDASPSIVRKGLIYGHAFIDAIEPFDGILDIELHKRYYDVKELVKHTTVP